MEVAIAKTKHGIRLVSSPSGVDFFPSTYLTGYCVRMPLPPREVGREC